MDVAQVTAQEIDLMKLNAFNLIITIRSHHCNTIHPYGPPSQQNFQIPKKTSKNIRSQEKQIKTQNWKKCEEDSV